MVELEEAGRIGDPREVIRGAYRSVEFAPSGSHGPQKEQLMLTCQ
jgi:hypothetical protein